MFEVEPLRVVAHRESVIVARIGNHQLVPDVARTAWENQPIFELEELRIAIPGNRELRRGLPQLLASRKIGHQPFLS